MLCSNPTSALIITQHHRWNIPQSLPAGIVVPPEAPAELQDYHKLKYSFLGSIMTLSVYSNHKIALMYFSSEVLTNQPYINTMQTNNLAASSAASVVELLLKHADTRSAAFDWLATQFFPQGKSRVTMAGTILWKRDPRLHEVDGPHLTLSSALLHLCSKGLAFDKVPAMKIPLPTSPHHH